MEDRLWNITPRLPLGRLFSGECRADGESIPSLELLRDCCNFGYARGVCPHFPDSAEADAVRFSALRSPGDTARVHWVMEKDHWPGSHGELADCRSEILQRQAEVFLESLKLHEPK